MYLAFYAQFSDIEGIFMWLRLFSQPMGCPADEVCSKKRHAFLQENGGLGAHLDTMDIEDLFNVSPG